METTKTHYRKVFKSDHLGVADLEDMIEEKKRLVFTVKEVKQEIGVSVAGRKGNHNIAYFVEDIKPLVLNAVNSSRMKAFNDGSPFVEDWSNTLIELYIDPNVKMKGDVVGGVRINPTQPALKKPELTPDHKKWGEAVNYMKKPDSKIDAILKHWEMTEENKNKLMEEAI
jgi:hypothetical protein